MLPHTEQSLVLRTDFSDDGGWESLCEEIRRPEPENGFQAYVDCVSDRQFEGVTPAQIVAMASDGFEKSFVFLVDRMTIENEEHPLVVIDLFAEPGRMFRVIPVAMWSVENNLSLANLDFADFVKSCGEDGIYRGM